MTPETIETQENERSQNTRRLLVLLVSFLLVLASLICCGQVALLIDGSSRVVDTLSLLKADYGPWGYEKVGAINLAGFKEDVQKDQATGGVAVVIPGDDVTPGVFWPTSVPTGIPVAAVTETASLTPTDLFAAPSATDTATLAPTLTHTPTISGGMQQGTATRTPTPTRTVTSTQPVITVTHTSEPTPTRTNSPVPSRTFTQAPQPTRTHTPEPVDPSDTPIPPTRTQTPTRMITTPAATFTRTPTRTNTTAPVATRTFTPTPTRTSTAVAATRTFTPTPTHTNTSLPATSTFTPTATHTPTVTQIVVPPTFTFTPTTGPAYLVDPKPENGGLSDPDPGNPDKGCIGFFGYVNTNPQPVDIPPGSSNYLSPDAYEVTTGDPYYSTGLPTTFFTGEWSGILQVKWDSGTPITWTINGRSATLNWCR